MLPPCPKVSKTHGETPHVADPPKTITGASILKKPVNPYGVFVLPRAKIRPHTANHSQGEMNHNRAGTVPDAESAAGWHLNRIVGNGWGRRAPAPAPARSGTAGAGSDTGRTEQAPHRLCTAPSRHRTESHKPLNNTWRDKVHPRSPPTLWQRNALLTQTLRL